MHNFKISCCFTAFIVACIFASCSEEATTDILTSNDEIGFTAFYGYDNAGTRGAVIDKDGLKSFNVSAYAYTGSEKDPDHDYEIWPATTSSPNFITNEVVKKGTPWTTDNNHYWPNADMRMRFFGFANFDGSPAKFSSSYTQIENYTVPTEVKDQKDIIAAVSDVSTAEYRKDNKSVPMHFHHIFTGIKFKTTAEETLPDGSKNIIDEYIIKSIGFENVSGSGTFTLKKFEYKSGEEEKGNESNLKFELNRKNMWSDLSEANKSFMISFGDDGKALSRDMDITGGSDDATNVMMMIPQVFDENSNVNLVVELTDKNNETKTFRQKLSTSDWGMGQMIVYRIFARETSVDTTFGVSYTVCPWDKKTINIPSFN